MRGGFGTSSCRCPEHASPAVVQATPKCPSLEYKFNWNNKRVGDCNWKWKYKQRTGDRHKRFYQLATSLLVEKSFLFPVSLGTWQTKLLLVTYLICPSQLQWRFQALMDRSLASTTVESNSLLFVRWALSRAHIQLARNVESRESCTLMKKFCVLTFLCTLLEMVGKQTLEVDEHFQ